MVVNLLCIPFEFGIREKKMNWKAISLIVFLVLAGIDLFLIVTPKMPIFYAFFILGVSIPFFTFFESGKDEQV